MGAVSSQLSSNVTLKEQLMQCDDGGSYFIGVGMGLIGSVGINIGQNLQSNGLKSLADRTKPCRSRTWTIGVSIFICSSLINFLAFAFAPATVLVSLEAVQYVTNVIFNRFINRVLIPFRIYGGVGLAVLGTTMVVGFGPKDSALWTIDDLLARWSYAAWWIYLVFSSTLCLLSYSVHRSYCVRVRHVRALRASLGVENAPEMPWRREIVLPVSFAIYSAQCGSLMIVQSKAISEVMAIYLCTEGEIVIWAAGYFWMTLTLLLTLGGTWLWKMNEGLGLYDPLFIIPLLQGMYITMGVVAGGIFFGEFESMAAGRLPPFVGGILLVLWGIYWIAPRDADPQRKNSFAPGESGALDGDGGSPPRTSSRMDSSNVGSGPKRTGMPLKQGQLEGLGQLEAPPSQACPPPLEAAAADETCSSSSSGSAAPGATSIAAACGASVV